LAARRATGSAAARETAAALPTAEAGSEHLAHQRGSASGGSWPLRRFSMKFHCDACADRNRWAWLADLNLCICRSRRRVGRCEFSAPDLNWAFYKFAQSRSH
jgi:hypothetical protein